MIEVKIDKNLTNLRVDKAIRKILPYASTAFICKMVRKKNITLNHKKTEISEKTNEGDILQFYFSDETFGKLKTEPTKETDSNTEPLSSEFSDLEILYEDEDMILFMKPAGLLSQKSANSDYSANDWVLSHWKKNSSDVNYTFRPSVVNRLDRNTSGIMAAGLSLKGLQTLSDLFKNHTLTKNYYALVFGKAKEHAFLTGYLQKDNAENTVIIAEAPVENASLIKTEYKLLTYDEKLDMSLLKVTLLTGKSHQIRAHLSSVSLPIVGDPKYGDVRKNKSLHIKGQCLHAYEMVFPKCPLSVSEKTFRIGIPSDWPISYTEDLR